MTIEDVVDDDEEHVDFPREETPGDTDDTESPSNARTEEAMHPMPEYAKQQGPTPPCHERYCQPTSSRVRMEDLITDDMDEEHHREFHAGNEEEEYNTAQPRRRFWDRPVTPVHMAWLGDARMPVEWNMMINDTRGMVVEDITGERKPRNTSNHATRDGESVTSSLGPFEFTRSRYPNRATRETLKQRVRVEPEIGSDETLDRLAKMQELNENCNHRWETDHRPEPKPWKGKGRMPYSEDDIPSLRQGWYDEFESLLQGVPEEMPPF